MNTKIEFKLDVAIVKTFNPLHIGLDGQGKFDPEHVDFEVCFGFSHTRVRMSRCNHHYLF